MPSSEIYCAKTIPPRATRARENSVGKSAVPGKPRIVIIEDEFLVAWHLQTMLRDLDLGSCETASDVQSGVDLELAQQAELLLVDVNLSDGLDGVEAVRRIREYRSVAVIFITAYTDEANLNRIRQLTPDAPILSKPVTSDLLRTTIRKLFPPF